MPDGCEAFTPLAEDYALYRPGYPGELLDELACTCALTPDWTVADIGSGTGNLARLFLEGGHHVVGIEPNREMRQAGERLLAAYPSFHSLEGTAECIPLAAKSMDLVTVGQALHWFDVDQAKREFRRILRGENWVAVAWNDRLPDAAGFAGAYQALTRASRSRNPSLYATPLSAGLDRLFDGFTPRHVSFPHTQHFDLQGLLGRARSSGYFLDSGDLDLTARMTELFYRYQHEGQVVFHYMTQLYIGQL